jgi:hypothetical protein
MTPCVLSPTTERACKGNDIGRNNNQLPVRQVRKVQLEETGKYASGEDERRTSECQTLVPRRITHSVLTPIRNRREGTSNRERTGKRHVAIRLMRLPRSCRQEGAKGS